MINKQKEKHTDETPLDDYEKELQSFLNKGEFASDPNFKKNKKIFEKMAREHIELEESKRITIRLKKKDLILIKARAKQKNIPYQTLINLVLRDYTEGNRRIYI